MTYSEESSHGGGVSTRVAEINHHVMGCPSTRAEAILPHGADAARAQAHDVRHKISQTRGRQSAYRERGAQLQLQELAREDHDGVVHEAKADHGQRRRQEEPRELLPRRRGVRGRRRALPYFDLQRAERAAQQILGRRGFRFFEQRPRQRLALGVGQSLDALEEAARAAAARAPRGRPRQRAREEHDDR